MTVLRTAGYEGTPGNNLTAGAVNASSIVVNGGGAVYDSSHVWGSTSARFTGNTYIIFNTSSNILGWAGWIYLPTTDPAANRAILQLDSTPQASIWWHANGILLRTTSNTTVDTYAGFTGGAWHGIEWLVNRSGSTVSGVANGQQRARIYDADLNLLDTLTGACGTGWTSFREGHVSGGVNADYALFDQTVLANEVVNLSLPAPPAPIVLTPYVKVGGVETELTPYVKVGGVETPLTPEIGE